MRQPKKKNPGSPGSGLSIEPATSPHNTKILAMKSQVGIVRWIIGNAEYSKCQPTDFEQRICKINK